MTRNKMKGGKKGGPLRKKTDSTESLATESVTIFWMLSLLTLTVTDIGSIGSWFYTRLNPESARVKLLLGLLLFAGLIISVMGALAMMWVHKARKHPPPARVSVYAVIVIACPWLMYWLLI